MTSAFYIKDVIIIESAAVTLDSKVLLNIKEASDLFEIDLERQFVKIMETNII